MKIEIPDSLYNDLEERCQEDYFTGYDEDENVIYGGRYPTVDDIATILLYWANDAFFEYHNIIYDDGEWIED